MLNKFLNSITNSTLMVLYLLLEAESVNIENTLSGAYSRLEQGLG